MNNLTIILAVVNLAVIVLGAVYFHPIRNALLSGSTKSKESEADRTVTLLRGIGNALAEHASRLDAVESATNEESISALRQSNRQTGDTIQQNSQKLDSLLEPHGDAYRTERDRIQSYAQNVSNLDDMLMEFGDESDESNRVLLKFVQDTIKENRQLQSKVHDCQEQVTELIALSAKSEREARTDALTNLPNRRAWDERISRLTETTTIALIDVDSFKSINDNFGHAAGDAMLTLIGTILRNTREIDAYRIGGDEFGLLIQPGREQHIAEQVRRKVGSAVLNYGQDRLSVSISIGFANHNPDQNFSHAIRSADDALYAAKEANGNVAMSAQMVN